MILAIMAKTIHDNCEGLMKKHCPMCGEPSIDTSKPAANFWRCGVCHQAIVERNGRLQPWLNPMHQPTRKKRKFTRGLKR
jgi:ribosomal protein L37AE/L43A